MTHSAANFIRNRLADHLNQRGDATALVDFVSGPITWRRLVSMVTQALSDLEPLAPDRPVAHLSNNTAADAVVALACAVLGRLEAPLDHRIADHEVRRRLQLLGVQPLDSELKQSWMDASDGPAVGRTPVPSNFADQILPADGFGGIVLWTSGTTSDPLGVHLSHESWISNARAKLAAAPQTEDDVRLTVLPLCHAYARTCDLATWLLTGGTLGLSLGYEAMREMAMTVRPTLINCVPSIADRLLTEPAAKIGLDRLRMIGVGGAALSANSFARWKQLGIPVIQGYGQTETGPVICSATPDNASEGLVGDFVDGWEHQIRGGELWVRGGDQMKGYWKDPQATAQKIDEQGWLRTGDAVQWDAAAGQLRILGRVDDVIVLPNGNKIHPSKIEKEACGCDGVRHAVLVWRRSHLELWIDGDHFDPAQIEALLAADRRLGSVAVHRFNDQLTAARGHLTAKGTVRRQQVLDSIGDG